MNYLSVCSGIEAATCAWHPLGWNPVAFSEIEKFPSQVLAHHYPSVPNLGDMTKFEEWPDATIDLLVGGTPCQSFSVAGLRKGLADPRGNLMLTYGAIARRYRPKWLVWENVPGVLSSNGGRDFGTFLGMLGQLGYGFSYRVLDAQFFGVAQRRRRVFVVGCLGDWRSAAAVLFERHSLQGNPAPSREAGEGIAGGTGAGAEGGSRHSSHWNGGVHPPLSQGAQKRGGGIGASNQEIFEQGGAGLVQAFGGNNTAGPIDVATARNACASASASGRMDFESETFLVQPAVCVTGQVTHALKAEGFDASEDGTGRGQPIVVHGTQDPCVSEHTAFALGRNNGGENAILSVSLRGREGGATAELGDEVGNCLRASGGGGDKAHVLAPVVFQPRRYSDRDRMGGEPSEVCHTLSAAAGQGDSSSHAATSMQVRRLTPRECERLQGFPDDYTLIPVGKKMAADGPRYKALGNSMAVPCMAWIGKRIQLVEQIKEKNEVAA